MAKPTRQEQRQRALQDLRCRRSNRRLDEIVELLTAWGFTCRKATKEQGGVWQRGTRTLTLPKPHGNWDRTLAARLIRYVIAEIEAAELEDPLETD